MGTPIGKEQIESKMVDSLNLSDEKGTEIELQTQTQQKKKRNKRIPDIVCCNGCRNKFSLIEGDYVDIYFVLVLIL